MPNLEQYQNAHQRTVEFYADFASKKIGGRALAKQALRYLEAPSFTIGDERVPTTTLESYIAGVTDLLNNPRIPEEVREAVLATLAEKLSVDKLDDSHIAELSLEEFATTSS